MRNFTPASILVVAVWRIARITGAIFAASETFAEEAVREQAKYRFWETFAPWPLCVSL
jgi:hypothetical protein